MEIINFIKKTNKFQVWFKSNQTIIAKLKVVNLRHGLIIYVINLLSKVFIIIQVIQIGLTQVSLLLAQDSHSVLV